MQRLRTRVGSRPAPAALVTGAGLSRPDEIDARRRRYLITMTARTVLFALAVFAFHGWLRYAGVAFAMIAPYIAVMLANAAPPRPVESPSFVASARHDLRELEENRTVDHEG